ncbi:hypothetical protein R0K20_13805, partial [Staphylococcus sp. SIMBA_130]
NLHLKTKLNLNKGRVKNHLCKIITISFLTTTPLPNKNVQSLLGIFIGKEKQSLFLVLFLYYK